MPLQFLPTPNAPMARTRAKSPEWIVDVAERIADACIRDFIDVRGVSNQRGRVHQIARSDRAVECRRYGSPEARA